MKMTMFPYNKLDTYLPKLIRAGTGRHLRQGGRPKLTRCRGGREKDNPIKSFRYGKEEKEQAAQEEPVRTVKNAAGRNLPRKKNRPPKTKDGEEAKEKQERKPREPQMVTANERK
ncbi:MAG: hypothetical protein ACLUVZ_17095 [Bacteroides stercoris]